MTTDEKKEALQEAGVKVRSNASDDTIEELWEKHQADSEESTETESAEPEEVAITDEAPEDAVTVEDDEPTEPKRGKYSTMEDYKFFREQNATKHEGSKTPLVFEYANNNLSPKDFNALYEGKIVNGQKVKAK